MIPANLNISKWMIVRGELPGLSSVWLIYEILDRSDIGHCRYLGLLDSIEGESQESLIQRVDDRARKLVVSSVKGMSIESSCSNQAVV